MNRFMGAPGYPRFRGATYWSCVGAPAIFAGLVPRFRSS